MPEIGLNIRYVIDTNVIRDFWDVDDPERNYPLDLHQPLWDFIESKITTGEIIAPWEVKEQLEKTENKDLITWVRAHKYMFIKLDDAPDAIQHITRIVDAYPYYKFPKVDQVDAIVIAFACAFKCAVFSSEKWATTHSERKPKVPNVAKDMGRTCYNISQFLRQEKYQPTTVK